MMIGKQTLNYKIISLIGEGGMGNVYLGEMIGKSFETVNAYCSNRRQPSLDLLYEISTALNCPVKDLLTDNKDIKKK